MRVIARMAAPVSCRQGITVMALVFGFTVAAVGAESGETCPGTAAQPYAVVYPNGGQEFHVGDVISLQFCTSDPDRYPIAPARRPSIWFSPDAGLNYCMIVEYLESNSRAWTVPDSVADWTGKKFSTVSDSCLIQIRDYSDASITDASDGFFAVRQRVWATEHGPGHVRKRTRSELHFRETLEYTLRGESIGSARSGYGVAGPGRAGTICCATDASSGRLILRRRK